jgi:hypothetical protein
VHVIERGPASRYSPRARMIKLTEGRETAPMRGYIPTTRVEPAGHVDGLFARNYFTKLFQVVVANIRQDRQDTANDELRPSDTAS